MPCYPYWIPTFNFGWGEVILLLILLFMIYLIWNQNRAIQELKTKLERIEDVDKKIEKILEELEEI
ncbi:hypothetical protein [Archaeoglobus sp.]